MIYLLSLVLVLLVSGLLYSIYKSKTYKKPTQVVTAITGALVLVLILYTYQSDY